MPAPQSEPQGQVHVPLMLLPQGKFKQSNHMWAHEQGASFQGLLLGMLFQNLLQRAQLTKSKDQIKKMIPVVRIHKIKID